MALNITIRPCRQDECPVVLDLWNLAESTPSISDSIEALKLMLLRDDDLLLVAEYHNRIIGTVMGGWDGWRANIYRLAVLPQYRRQGIGRALVKEIEKRLRLKGTRKISIMIEGNDELAKIFWSALDHSGYKYDPRIIRYVKNI